MKKICYIVPYFGKFPSYFQVWLDSCKFNEDIDWIIYTDDKTSYNYPNNVIVNYCTFEDMKNRIQKHYNFKICLDRPWKLCDFRPAFGEIFSEDIKKYDFWGHCDIDLLWGKISHFITNDILDKYDKIGFQGHSTLYRNSKDVNIRYKHILDNEIDYKNIFSSKQGFCFDEDGIEEIYKNLNIKYYNKINFAHLSKYDYGFFLCKFPKEDNYKNWRQIFSWKNGTLLRHYIDKNKTLQTEEYMYIHFFCRHMNYKINSFEENITYVIYPDVVDRLNQPLNEKYILKHGKYSKVKYYLKNLYLNRHKITFQKIINNIKGRMTYKRRYFK